MHGESVHGMQRLSHANALAGLIYCKSTTRWAYWHFIKNMFPIPSITPLFKLDLPPHQHCTRVVFPPTFSLWPGSHARAMGKDHGLEMKISAQ